MKKTLLVMLALVMTLATIAMSVSLVSADDNADAPAKYIYATHNEVTVDGTITLVPQKSHISAEDGTVTEPGHVATVEFVMDTKLENANMGAAWDLEKEKIYFAFVADGLVSADITLGGEVFEVDFVNGAVEGGQVFVSEDGKTAEIELPIDFDLKHNGANVYADLEVELKAAKDSTFDGAVAFSKYAAGWVYNSIHQASNPTNSAGASVGENKVITISDTADSTAAQRNYSIFWVANASKNVMWEYDINIKSMPKSVPNPNDGPDKWGPTPEARVWAALMWRKGDVVYYDFYNTADDGIVVAVYRQTAGFVAEKEMVVVPTGKQTGETFTFGLEWNEENTVGIYIDHVLVKEIANGGCANAGLGKSAGALQFNTQRTGAFGVGESIEVEYSNISVNEVLNEYDEEALKELSKTPVVVPTETTTESETTTVTTPAVSETITVEIDTTSVETTTAETTTVETTAGTDAVTTKAPAATTEAEKGGCGSSLVAYGAVMVVGSALMAVVATSKKKED